MTEITIEQFISQEVRIRLLQENLKRIDERFDKLTSLLIKIGSGLFVTIIAPVALHLLGWI